jgi:hypothetical protein
MVPAPAAPQIQQPQIQQPQIQQAQIRQMAAERLVEIDRLLAAPVTGRSDDSSQRALLRAERASLIASGQVPYRMQTQFEANHNRTVQSNAPLATVTQRAANGDVVNYAPATTQTGRIIVAPNSQDHNLSRLEAMTPTERKHHFRELEIVNPRPIVPVYYAPR